MQMKRIIVQKFRVTDEDWRGTGESKRNASGVREGLEVVPEPPPEDCDICRTGLPLMSVFFRHLLLMKRRKALSPRSL